MRTTHGEARGAVADPAGGWGQEEEEQRYASPYGLGDAEMNEKESEKRQEGSYKKETGTRQEPP